MNKKKLYSLAAVTALSLIMLGGCSTSDKATGPSTELSQGHKFIAKDSSFLVGKDGTISPTTNIKDKAVVDVYLDPLCPGCAEFERTTGDYIAEKMKTGKLLVRYHPLMFLDSQSSDEYSSRASAYILGVAEYEPKLISKFMTAIFSKEFAPEEGSYVATSNAKFDELFTKIGGSESAKNSINAKLKTNMEKTYNATMAVMKSSDLKAKSQTGQLFTPFVIPNAPGKYDADALMFSTEANGILTTTKAAIDKILK